MKPHLKRRIGGWAVYGSEGRLEEWYLDFGSACESAKTIDSRMLENCRAKFSNLETSYLNRPIPYMPGDGLP